MALLGRYTLFAYLFQMLVLRVLVAVNHAAAVSGWPGYFLYVAATATVTYAAVVLLDQLRQRGQIDAFYRLAFG